MVPHTREIQTQLYNGTVGKKKTYLESFSKPTTASEAVMLVEMLAVCNIL